MIVGRYSMGRISSPWSPAATLVWFTCTAIAATRPRACSTCPNSSRIIFHSVLLISRGAAIRRASTSLSGTTNGRMLRKWSCTSRPKRKSPKLAYGVGQWGQSLLYAMLPSTQKLLSPSMITHSRVSRVWYRICARRTQKFPCSSCQELSK